MIKDFVSLKLEEVSRIVSNLKRLLEVARKAEVPIIYANHVLKSKEGSKVVDDLKPAKGDLIIEKSEYSAFSRTGLDKMLRKLRVKDIILVGIYTDLCIKHTIADAFHRGYRIVVPYDCVESYEEDNSGALSKLKKVYDVEVTSSKTLIKQLLASSLRVDDNYHR